MPVRAHALAEDIVYSEGCSRQNAARDRVLAGGTDEILPLSHAAVVTLGRRGGVVDGPALNVLNTPVIQSDRGGLATWHGPGQLVVYPIIDLKRRGLRVPEFVAMLGEAIVSALDDLAVAKARWDPCNPGVYIGAAKIASIGLHTHHGVTSHGLALNLSNDLSGFAAISVCGVQNRPMTTASLELGRRVLLSEGWIALRHALNRGDLPIVDSERF